MKKLIKDIIFAWKYKRAVRKADYLRHITHRKHMVIVIKGRLEVISKQDIRKFVAGGGIVYNLIKQVVCLSQKKIIV